MKENPLPFAHFDRIAISEHAVIDRRIVINGVHGRVGPAAHVRVPVVQSEKYLLIVCTWRLFRLNVETSELAAVPSALQIVPSKRMGVVPAKARWPRRKAVAPLAARRNHGRTFFR